MKRFGAFLAAALLSVGVLAGCGGGNEASGNETSGGDQQLVTLKVGATPVPHAQILEHIKPMAKEQGIDLEVIEFTDFVQPNIALADGQLDANYFQHKPYLDNFVQERGVDLVSVGAVHLEPMGLYSVKYSDADALPDGALITIPSDPSNGGRALYLLQDVGLIKLRDDAGIEATVEDIVENPKNLTIETMDAEQLPRTLEDADASVINTNYYLEAKNNLGLDATILAQESAEDNPYANIVAVRKGDENRPEIQKLMELLHSEEVREYIESTYDGAVIPAF